MNFPACLFLCCSAAFSSTLLVPSQYTTIQNAINAAQDGDSVLVSPGRYTERIWFNGKAIAVIGTGGASQTVMRPNYSGSVVHFIEGETSSSVLRGFTLTHGTNTDFGGGIRCENSSPMIVDNRIVENSADYGGGICCLGGSPTIQGNWIERNGATSGGGIYCIDSSPSIIENTITAHEVDSAGAGIACFGGEPLIAGNLITDNSIASFNNVAYGGGLFAGEGCILHLLCNTFVNNQVASYPQSPSGGGACVKDIGGVIAGNTFIDNGAVSGGGLYIWGCDGLVITNSVFAWNNANKGAGIFCLGCPELTVRNCVIAANDGSHGTGIYFTGFYTGTYTLDLANSILRWNSNEPLYLPGGNSVQIANISYTDMEYGQDSIYVGEGSILNWGQGMIDADPLFVPGPLSNFHLDTDASPCIDAGDPDPLSCDPEDPLNPGYAMYPAQGGLRNDMGAYGGGGVGYWLGVEGESPPSPPESMQLRISPNPFISCCSVSIRLQEPSCVTLDVYDIAGRMVTRLLDGSIPAEEYAVWFDGTLLPAGTYILLLRSGESTASGRCVLVR